MRRSIHSRPTSAPRAGGDRIRVLVGGHQLAVVGGNFQDMLAVIKNLPGRRFDRDTKVWEIPGEIDVIKGMLAAAGLQLEGAEKLPGAPVPPMSPPDFLTKRTPPPPPPFEPPDFSEDEADFPYEPPDWWDEGPPP